MAAVFDLSDVVAFRDIRSSRLCLALTLVRVCEEGSLDAAILDTLISWRGRVCDVVRSLPVALQMTEMGRSSPNTIQSGHVVNLRS